MNPEGEGRHEQVRAKITRKEKIKRRWKKRLMERPSDGGAEIQSPKRKVIRVESEETQDYLREALNLSEEGTRRNKFRAKRDQLPTKAHVLV